MSTLLAPAPENEGPRNMCRICKKVPVSRKNGICPRCVIRSGGKPSFKWNFGDSSLKKNEFRLELLKDDDLKEIEDKEVGGSG